MNNMKRVTININNNKLVLCISYDVVVAVTNYTTNRDYIIDKYYKYSNSTSAHILKFFGIDSKEIKKYIESGKIKLINYNEDLLNLT